MSHDTLPKHIGIILDGNRRWAKQAGLKTLDGHKKGAEVFKELSLDLFDKGVSYISAYVFSTENWNRAAEEVDYLMRLVVRAVELHLDEYPKKGIRIRILGLKDNLQPAVLKAIKRTEEKTADNANGTLALCFNYGGRQELVNACREIAASDISPDEITPEMITEHVYAPDIPDLDLLIRTSGEQRTSGFMMWRAWYAEMMFIDKFWPDMTTEDMDQALEEYAQRQRRFGC